MGHAAWLDVEPFVFLLPLALVLGISALCGEILHEWKSLTLDAGQVTLTRRDGLAHSAPRDGLIAIYDEDEGILSFPTWDGAEISRDDVRDDHEWRRVLAAVAASKTPEGGATETFRQ